MTTGGPRSDGPALVRTGPAEAATVLVLDPAGEAKHRGLPATWRPLTRQVEVRWHRVPAADRPPDPPGRFHLVSGGTATGAALDLADRRRNEVESVLLVDPSDVDPDADPGLDPDIGDPAGYPVTVIRPGDRDHPTPLGHPAVVERVVRTPVEADADAAGPVPERAAVPSFLSDVWTALTTVVRALIP